MDFSRTTVCKRQNDTAHCRIGCKRTPKIVAFFLQLGSKSATIFGARLQPIWQCACVISWFDLSFAASLVLALLFYCSFFLRKEKVVIVSKYFKGSFWSMAESYGWISKKILVVSIWIIIGIVFLLTGSEKEIWKVWRVGQFRHLIMSFGNSKSTQKFWKAYYIVSRFVILKRA